MRKHGPSNESSFSREIEGENNAALPRLEAANARPDQLDWWRLCDHHAKQLPMLLMASQL